MPPTVEEEFVALEISHSPGPETPERKGNGAEAAGSQGDKVDDLMKMVLEMKVSMATLLEDSKRKDEIIENLKKTIEEKRDKDKGTGKDDDAGRKKLQAMKSKDVPKPGQYDLSPTEFVEWHELFKATMIGHDPLWEEILKKFQNIPKQNLKADEIKQMLKDMEMTDADVHTANYTLYVQLLAYTKGALLDKVKNNESVLAMESYRFLHSKGHNATTMNVVKVTTATLRPSIAQTNSEVDAKLNAWKANIKYLDALGKPSMENDQRKSVLLSILPWKLQEFMMQYYDTEPMYDDFEAKLTDYITRTEQQQAAKGGKDVGSVSGGANVLNEEEPNGS